MTGKIPTRWPSMLILLASLVLVGLTARNGMNVTTSAGQPDWAAILDLALPVILPVIAIGVGLWQTEIQMSQLEEQRKQAVLPHPVLKGGFWMLGTTLTSPREATPVSASNAAEGAALNLEWEVTMGLAEMGESDLLLMKEYTGLTDLSKGKESLLVQRFRPEGFEIPENARLTLWCDDLTGAHYQCVWQREAGRWKETERKKIRARPARRHNTTGL